MANYELRNVPVSVDISVNGGYGEAIINLINSLGMVVGDVTSYNSEGIPWGRECWFEDIPEVKFRAVRYNISKPRVYLCVETNSGNWSYSGPAIEYDNETGLLDTTVTKMEKIKLANGGYFVQGIEADGDRTGYSVFLLPMFDFYCQNFISWVTISGNNTATRRDTMELLSGNGLCNSLPISVIDTTANVPKLADNEMVLSTIARENRVAYPHFALNMLANSTISLNTNIKERIVVNGGEMFIVRTNRGYISYFPEPTEEETPKT